MNRTLVIFQELYPETDSNVIVYIDNNDRLTVAVKQKILNQETLKSIENIDNFKNSLFTDYLTLFNIVDISEINKHNKMKFMKMLHSYVEDNVQELGFWEDKYVYSFDIHTRYGFIVNEILTKNFHNISNDRVVMGIVSCGDSRPYITMEGFLKVLEKEAPLNTCQLVSYAYGVNTNNRDVDFSIVDEEQFDAVSKIFDKVLVNNEIVTDSDYQAVVDTMDIVDTDLAYLNQIVKHFEIDKRTRSEVVKLLSVGRYYYSCIEYRQHYLSRLDLLVSNIEKMKVISNDRFNGKASLCLSDFLLPDEIVHVQLVIEEMREKGFYGVSPYVSFNSGQRKELTIPTLTFLAYLVIEGIEHGSLAVFDDLVSMIVDSHSDVDSILSSIAARDCIIDLMCNYHDSPYQDGQLDLYLNIMS